MTSFFSQDAWLLLYMVIMYITMHSYELTLCFLFQCAGTLASTFPLPDPTDLLGASHIRFEELRADLFQLTTDLGGAYKSQSALHQAVVFVKRG